MADLAHVTLPPAQGVPIRDNAQANANPDVEVEHIEAFCPQSTPLFAKDDRRDRRTLGFSRSTR